MIQQWWASSHDDADPMIKKKKMTWRLEDEEGLNTNMTWQLKDEEDLKTKKTWTWQDDPVDVEKKTNAENCVERIPS